MSPARELGSRLRVLVIADADAAQGRDLVQIVEAAIAGGAGAIQLRAKRGSAREMAEMGRRLSYLTRRSSRLLFINDRVDVAMAIGADGAHLGDDDLPLSAVRAIAPAGFLLGRSVDTPEEARLAEREGADYVGAGPVYSTPSKVDTGPVIGLDGLAAIRSATRLPVVGIGGIDASNAEEVARTGIAGVAVIRGVIATDDPRAAAFAIINAVARGQGSGGVETSTTA
jgi:thiamine-phosphate pyrophosphorylase